MANSRIDPATGTETVGHEWDGIEELDTPMPRWWLWTFYLTIVFAIGYVIAYPAWPMVDRATKGVLNWSSRGDLARDMDAAEQARTGVHEALSRVPVERLPDDSALLAQAVAGGRAAFQVHCTQCHGSGGAGSQRLGYPNLNDDDWLWGGDLRAIEFTLVNGIRAPGHDDTRQSQMPPFEGVFDPVQMEALIDHVLALSGKAENNRQGAQIFADNCAACHGEAGGGSRALGAPRLNDAIWLRGSTREDIRRQILNPRMGVMPAWENRLDPATIRMLAAYVHSLGGGEDFIAKADDPAVEVDDRP
ncbi:cytochrome-c oxidase, cbb3-type subunit III [uncultured Croceicoccus sp.]|uniref:cytochrome-c oxidase, cbb3-type subunit III n=1 Tax=uncultured Croceicoccus sp. TaxID=1295329 RepID=UPI002628F064|nr:cytochrome-c oxidase, cbb3-type subunit III [uncultured Croceicoccus sp.]